MRECNFFVWCSAAVAYLLFVLVMLVSDLGFSFSFAVQFEFLLERSNKLDFCFDANRQPMTNRDFLSREDFCRQCLSRIFCSFFSSEDWWRFTFQQGFLAYVRSLSRILLQLELMMRLAVPRFLSTKRTWKGTRSCILFTWSQNQRFMSLRFAEVSPLIDRNEEGLA